MESLELGDLAIEVEMKDIKNVHLSVYPPNGRVRIAAPLRMSLDTIRIYAISRLSWIKKQQQKIRAQARETPREFLNKESHYFLGKRYMLKIIERDAPPKVLLKHSTIEMYVRPGTDLEKKQQLMSDWYRTQLKNLLPPVIEKCEKRMGVSLHEFAIKKMKTKWGTCNIEKKRIWLNLELAKKPIYCIEYIIVHEMTHLLERHHNDRFISLMDHFLPEWREVKRELNVLPVSHVGWGIK